MGIKETAVLLLSCADRKGIVAEISRFIFIRGGNIIHSDQHTDFESGVFFMRIEWELEKFKIPPEKIEEEFKPIAARFSMKWRLHFSSAVPRMAVWVSKMDHCLYELLLNRQSGEWKAEISLMISNHPDLKPVADHFQVDFHLVPIDPARKEAAEEKELKLLEDYRIDLIVLARYMQVLSPEFVSGYPNRIINIHHSFLPAFTGARPYHQAYERGVKLIGATSHYVTADLDNGPIIAQDVVSISHRDSVNDLVRKGKDLERTVLSKAVRYHLDNKTLVFGNKTIVFD